MHFQITELHNFGGFFGGDTVTLSGAAWPEAPAETQTLTIDQAALVNVADRHTLTVGMLLDLEFVGERIERATLLGATNPDELRAALGAPHLPTTIAAPLLLSHVCSTCSLWVPSEQTAAGAACPLCSTAAIAAN